jgi:histidinol-phosphate aminotransferase
MTHINRRQWLKTAGLSGAFSLLGGGQLLSGRHLSDNPFFSPSDPEATPVRLSSNENPYGPSEAVRQAIVDAFDKACRYPWGYYKELQEAVARREGVPADHIVLTAGSGEGLKAAGLTYGQGQSEIVAPDPTYLALMQYAEQFGAYIHRVRLNADLQHDLEGMERRITARTSLVFVCNPNNPTGSLLPAQALRDFCRSVSDRTLVFADEAYFDYVEEKGYPSMVELVKEGRNVVVSRTFSKVFGLAGVRAGYLVARPDVARRIGQNTMANPNIFAVFAAQAALKDEEFFHFSLRKNREAKAMIYKTLDELRLPYLESHANFVFFQAGRDVRALADEFQQKGVLIGRPFPPLYDWCRISTGALEEVEVFCRVARQVMS